MARTPCCDQRSGLKKGTWTPEEDRKLIAYVTRYGHWNWRLLPKFAGLARCGKSCRLRWMNYLRPNIKRGNFTPQEEDTIIKLQAKLGNRWSKIAAHLPGRSDNEIKNHWHSTLKKRLHIPNSSSHSHQFTQETSTKPLALLSSSSSPLELLELELETTNQHHRNSDSHPNTTTTGSFQTTPHPSPSVSHHHQSSPTLTIAPGDGNVVLEDALAFLDLYNEPIMSLNYFWTCDEPHNVIDISYFPPELLPPLFTESELLTPFYGAQLWSHDSQ